MPAPIERLILHIGTYKTGTSSVQKFLDERRSELRKVGVCYPQVGMGDSTTAPGHHEFALLADQGQGQVSSDLRRLATAALEEFAASGCTTLILSAEDFCSIYFPAAVLAAFLPSEQRVRQIASRQAALRPTGAIESSSVSPNP